MILIDTHGHGVQVVPVLGTMLPESGHKFAIMHTDDPESVFLVDVYRAYHNPAELVVTGYKVDGREKFLFDSTGKLIPSRKDDALIGKLWLLQVREVKNG